MSKFYIEIPSYGGSLSRIEIMVNKTREAIEHDKSVLYSFIREKYKGQSIDVILIGHNPRLTVDTANSLLENCEAESVYLHLIDTSLDMRIDEMIGEGIKDGFAESYMINGESINLAISSVMGNVQSDIVVVMFAGVLLSNNWLEATLKEFEEPNVEMVFGLSNFDLDMLPGWDYRSFSKMVSFYSDGIPTNCFVSSRSFFAIKKDMLKELISTSPEVSHGEVADIFMRVFNRGKKIHVAKDLFYFDQTIRSDYTARWMFDNKSGFSSFYDKWKKHIRHFSADGIFAAELRKLTETFRGLQKHSIEFSETKQSVVFVFREAVVCGAVLAAIHICNKLIEHGYNAFFACTRLDGNEARKLPMKFEPLVCESEIDMIRKVQSRCEKGFVIAPLWITVNDAVKICEGTNLKPIYYVQDDERLFTLPNGKQFNDTEEVGKSYTAIPNVVSNSIWVKNFLKNDFNVESTRIGIGVDPLMFYPRDKPKEVITVMAHCRPSTPRRGWDFIKDVLTEVARVRNIGISLYDEVDDTFVQSGSWITHHRKVSPVQLSQLMGEAHIFIEGSIIQGWGMQALEAMACGCALVSTANKGIDSYGTSGLDCLIIPHGDVQLAVALVCKLIDDFETRYFLASHARKTANRFDWGTIVGGWVSYFNSFRD